MAVVSSSGVDHHLTREQTLGTELGDGAEEAAPTMVSESHSCANILECFQSCVEMGEDLDLVHRLTGHPQSS
jgi:hypothetical protein